MVEVVRTALELISPPCSVVELPPPRGVTVAAAAMALGHRQRP